MRLLSHIHSLALAATVTSTLALTGQVEAQTQWRIMPIGDSITAGTDEFDGVGFGGYRARLESRIQNAGISYNFVGGADDAFGSNANGLLDDWDHEGRPGRAINGFPVGDDFLNLRVELRRTQNIANSLPHLALVLVGTNDIAFAAGDPVNEGTILNGLQLLFDEIVRQSPDTILIVSSIPPTNPNSAEERAANSKIEQYNSILRSYVQERINDGDNFVFVDGYKAMNSPTTDINLVSRTANPETGLREPDGIHPSRSGYQKLADVWYEEIERQVFECYSLYRASSDLGDGFRESPTYGVYFDDNDPREGFKFHTEFGWIYVAEKEKSTQMWFNKEGWGWLWTNLNNYPIFYRQDDDSFYMLNIGDGDATNLTTGEDEDL